MLCKVAHCTGGAFQTVPSLTNCAGLTRRLGTAISYTEYSQMALPKRSEEAPQKLLKSTVSLYSCLSCEDHSNRNHASCKCKFMIMTSEYFIVVGVSLSEYATYAENSEQ